MKFFIDTADIKEIQKILKIFPVDGVTTNPSLISKAGLPLEECIPQICDLVNKPVSAEVINTESEKMYEEALKIAKLHEKTVVKIPLTPEGLKTVRLLKKEGVSVNVTLCFSPLQALSAALAGADMVSIFIGRLDDIEHSGIKVIRDTLKIFSNYSLKTQVLAASIRHTQHILDSALAGAHIITAPYKILSKIALHPLTDIGLKQFLESAKNSK